MAAASKNQSLLFSSCSVLMGLIFGYSALVQLNDIDWYFWLPLYTAAFVVNFFWLSISTKIKNQVAQLTLAGGAFLFIKVVTQALIYNGIVELWSLDMRKALVREKIGSGLVATSMILHLLNASKHSKDPKNGKKTSSLVDMGMAVLAAVSYGLTFYVFGYVNRVYRIDQREYIILS